ncbi:MAG TPA: alpha/beta hydrolase, partial [Pseudonocardia sp.]|nr:alpha/beta hydrolase [Pseudonocardia sp.]
ALVGDLSAFLDAHGLDRVVLVGQDWGAIAAQGVAALRPERVTHLVSLGSYALTWSDGDGFPPPAVLQALWYQWLLLTDLGPAVLRFERDAFCGHLWDVWSPTWDGRRAAFEAVRPSLAGDDFVDVVVSAYRHGRVPTVSDPRYDHLDAALAAAPEIPVPATILLGADDGVELPSPDDPRDARFFTDLRERRILPGAGHFPHREVPEVVAGAVLDAAGVDRVR